MPEQTDLSSTNTNTTILSHRGRMLADAQDRFLFASDEALLDQLKPELLDEWKVDSTLTLWELKSIPEPLSTARLRDQLEWLSETHARMAMRAQHLIHWRNRHRFCGHCGGSMDPTERELGLICQNCDAVVYPRISPCVIVLIEDGDRILLGHNRKFTPNRFSTFAGFIEAGETAEEAVRREIYEEVGVQLGSLRYFTSQPWPFPDSLMLGFFAEYQTGDIRPDGDEILEARWFKSHELDQVVLPPQYAISRRLINDWLGRQK